MTSIALLRMELKITQQQLSGLLGIPRSTLSMIELGHRVATGKEYDRIYRFGEIVSQKRFSKNEMKIKDGLPAEIIREINKHQQQLKNKIFQRQEWCKFNIEMLKKKINKIQHENMIAQQSLSLISDELNSVTITDLKSPRIPFLSSQQIITKRKILRKGPIYIYQFEMRLKILEAEAMHCSDYLIRLDNM